MKSTNKARVIAVANQKGGVGKTTTSVNLGVGLSKLGKKVLIIDFDPQNQIAKAFGITGAENLSITIPLKQIMSLDDELDDFDDVVIHHEKENVDVMVSGISLSAFETSIIGQSGQEQCLKILVERYRPQYDYIIIDTLPSLSILSINALNACDKVLIPVQAQEYAIDGLQELLKSIKKTKRFNNPNIDVLGILITMVDSRTNYNKDIANTIKNSFKDTSVPVFDTIIPRAISVEETTSAGCSIHEYDKKSTVSKAYLDLVNEVVHRG